MLEGRSKSSWTAGGPRGGERATVPAGVPHSVRNATDRPAKIVNIHQRVVLPGHAPVDPRREDRAPAAEETRSAVYAAMWFGKYPDEIRATKQPQSDLPGSRPRREGSPVRGLEAAVTLPRAVVDRCALVPAAASRDLRKRRPPTRDACPSSQGSTRRSSTRRHLSWDCDTLLDASSRSGDGRWERPIRERGSA